MGTKLSHSSNDRLETIQEIAADPPARRIYLFGDVDADMSWRAMTALDILDQKPAPITVILNSGGGDEYEGWAMYDAFRSAKSKIAVVAFGQAMSMAAILLQMGSTRLIAPNLRFMIHNGHGPDFGGSPHSSVLRAWGKEQEINDKRYAQVLAEHSGLSVDEVERLCVGETFMCAEEAVAKGFADRLYRGVIK